MAQRSRKRKRRGPASRGAAPAARPPAGAPGGGQAVAPGGGQAVAPGGAQPVALGGADAVAPESPEQIGGWKVEKPMTRSQRRDAAVRAGLVPIRPGERPAAIVIASVVAALLGLGNLVAYLAGVKIGGKHPAAGGIILFSLLMIVCAVGMWRLWYGAVLGFMALLAIITCLFALLLIEASNVLGVVVGLAVILGAGWLFFKLVRVLSRIQMPRPPGR
ncbi:MAG TPA: hypothetical protein VFN55_01370 [Solirubrobacteraceae bacterium]|nr:hypothetical protein [Solirubrobacteraceae bacterium]